MRKAQTVRSGIIPPPPDSEAKTSRGPYPLLQRSSRSGFDLDATDTDATLGSPSSPSSSSSRALSAVSVVRLILSRSSSPRDLIR